MNFQRFFKILLVFLLTCLPLCAASVEAELSETTTAVNRPIELLITATGAGQAELLDSVHTPDIQVVSESQSSQTSLQFPNFQKTVITQWRLTLVPLREGNYTIPALRVQVDGKTYRTQPQKFRVAAQRQGNAPIARAQPVQSQPTSGQQQQQPYRPSQPPVPLPAQSTQDNEGARGYFGEMLLERKSAYVGEIIPLDIRFSIDERSSVHFSDRISFAGEGFTVGKVSYPEQGRVEANGILYNSVTFRTAITPAKSGTLEIPVATCPARVQIAVQQSQRAPQGFGGLFDAFFQNAAFAEQRDIRIETDPVTLEVKPLPAANRPTNFDGAVGEFSISATATPKKAAPSEPITLKVTISGCGNFEAMGPPQLVDAQGWRTYDPAQKFEPSESDPSGISGQSTYEFTLVARKAQKETPAVSFSYFDPKKEKYITITAAPVPIEAAAASGSAVVSTPTQPANPNSTPLSHGLVVAPALPPPPTPEPEKTPSADMALIEDYTPSSFTPHAFHPVLLTIGSILVAFTLALLGWRTIRRLTTSAEGRAAIERRKLKTTLRRLSSVPPENFLDAAALFIETRLAGRDLESLSLSHTLLAEIRAILDRRAQAQFSARSIQTPDEAEREDMLTAIQKFDKEL